MDNGLSKSQQTILSNVTQLSQIHRRDNVIAALQ